MWKNILVLAIFAVSAQRDAEPLDPSRTIPQYVHNIWQIEQGLPQNSVNAILQTRDGYLWFGTQGGVARFDGIRFTVFDRAGTKGIPDDDISPLLEDHAGNLWCGTHQGDLLRFRDGKFTIFNPSWNPDKKAIMALYEDRSHSLWIGTDGGGLVRIKNEEIVAYTTRQGLTNNSVRSMQEDSAGDLWIGTIGGGISILHNGKIEPRTENDGLCSNIIRKIYRDRSGTLWLATSGGLNQYKDGQLTCITSRDGLSSDSVYSILEDRDGQLWIGTRSGLSRIVNGKINSYGTAQGLSNDYVRSLYEDREGSVWVGTMGGGLNRFRDGNFATFTPQDGLSGDVILSVFEDHAGNLWIGTEGKGLDELTNGLIVKHTTNEGLPNNTVLSFYESTDKALWIGTDGGGLCRFEKNHFVTYPSNDGILRDRVYCIDQDNDGGIWIGTDNGGLSKLVNGTFVTYTTKDGLCENSVKCLHRSADGTLWIGTNGGISRLRDGKFTSYTTREGLAGNRVYYIHEDKQGTLWIASYGGGLTRFKDGKMIPFTTAEGLFDSSLFIVLEDNSENLWMSCNRGVFRVSKKELEAFAQGKIRSIHSIAYNESDGMKSRECIGGHQSAGWRSRDGRLWFPTIRGLAVVDPSHLKSNSIAPPVRVESVIVNHNRELQRPGQSLPPDTRNIEFHYTALSYLAPERVQFKYRLDGFDREWVDPGPRRVAYYTSLPPGPYTFRVIASNNDGVWNDTGDSVSFSIEPHFYQTLWFYMLCTAALFFMAWTLHRIRLHQVQARFLAVIEERNRIARELHDTLAQTLTGASLHLKSAGDIVGPDHPAQKSLDLARNLVRTGHAESRRFVQDLRPQPLIDSDLPAALEKVARQLTSGTGVQIRIEVSGNKRPLPNSVEDNLLRIGQEAITNALKHAGAKSILIQLGYGDETIEMLVMDDGQGFDPGTTSGSGFGLTGMKERVEKLGGRIQVRSEKGKGTEIRAIVRI